MGALRRRPGQVVEEEEKEGRRAEREEGKKEADTQSGAIHRWMVYVGPGLTQEGRLALTQPRHLPLLWRALLSLSLSLDPQLPPSQLEELAAIPGPAILFVQGICLGRDH